jgi:hypothetical protein
LGDLLQKLKGGNGASALHHPFFWPNRKLLDFFGQLEEAFSNRSKRHLANQIEAQKEQIFEETWTNVDLNHSPKHNALILENSDKRHIGREQMSMAGLVICICNKTRHKCETAAAAQIQVGQDADLTIFAFLIEPFPNLMIIAWNIVSSP